MGGYHPICWEQDRTKDGGRANFLCLFLNWNIYLFPAFGHQSSWSFDLRTLGLPRCSPSPFHTFLSLWPHTKLYHQLSWFSSLQRTNMRFRSFYNYKCVCVCVCVCVHGHAWLCLTLYNHMDCSFLGPSVLGIFKARILEWVAVSSSRGSSWFRDWTHASRVSCIDRWILYHCTTWEAHHYMSQGNSYNKSHIFA